MFLRWATGIWLDAFAWSRALERKPAQRARGTLLLQRTDLSRAITVKIGTVIATSPINGVVYRVITTENRTFPLGVSQIEVPVQAEKDGSAYNISGMFSNILSTELAGLVRVTNTDNWLLVPGADAESDDDLRLRTRNRFTAINRWHVDATYRDIIADFAGIAVDEIFFEHTAPRGPGSANALILFDGATPAADYFEAINHHIIESGNHGFGDDLQAFPLYTQPIDIHANYKTKLGLSEFQLSTLQTNIEAFIRTAFRDLTESIYSPTRVTPLKTFAWSVLIAELHNQFPDITSFDFSVDADIECGLWVPRIHTLAVSKV